MPRGSIVSGKLLGALPGFFPAKVTIQKDTGAARTATGGTTASWTNVADHVDIDGAIAPVAADERREPGTTFADVTHRILLEGHYPDITERMRAVAGGITYQIMGVEHDQTQTLTALNTRIVR